MTNPIDSNSPPILVPETVGEFRIEQCGAPAAAAAMLRAADKPRTPPA